MYAKFYKLAEEPFPVTPDPKYLFLSDSHKEALASVVYGIENRRGFVAIVGEVGTGKTTILRAYLDAIDKDKYTVIYVYDPQVSAQELMGLIARELGVSVGHYNRAEAVSRIHHRLIGEYRNNRTVILIIDEAQNTPVATLEALRLLSNIETDETKLIQVVLAGQPELDKLLARHELRQLNQRIAVKSRIMPLSMNECRRYVTDRLAMVALEKRRIFDRAALTRIARFSRGIPRTLNIVCDTALINGYGHGAEQITDRIAKDAISALSGLPRSLWSFWKIATASVATTAIVAAAAWLVVFPGPARIAPPILNQLSQQTVTASEPVVGDPNPESTVIVHAPDKATENPLQASIIPGTTESTALVTQSDYSAPAASVLSTSTNVPGNAETGISNPADTTMIPADISQPSGLSRERIRWDSRPLPNDAFPIRHTIQKGQVISQICLEVYGFFAPKLGSVILASNSAISDINTIEPEQEIVLPALSSELQLLRSLLIEKKLSQPELANTDLNVWTDPVE